VVVADAYSVAHARMMAARLDPGRFVDGHRVNRASVALLPRDAVGRVLTLAELTAFVEARISRPPAPCGGRAGLARLRGDSPGTRFAHAVGLDAALAQLQAPR
jgi:hypothetical protein